MYVNELEVKQGIEGKIKLSAAYAVIDKKNFWVAQIAGKDEKFGLKRNFLKNAVFEAGESGFLLNDGLYEFFYRSHITKIIARGFITVEHNAVEINSNIGELDPQYKQEAKKEEESPLYK